MASAVYTDRIPESKRWGGWLNIASNAGIITDALVAANATVTLLKAAIGSAVVRGEQRPMVTITQKALDRAVSMGQVPETHGVTTVAALVALGDGSTSHRQSYFG
jgi:hypothetical protein